jgi:hypothetical protein
MPAKQPPKQIPKESYFDNLVYRSRLSEYLNAWSAPITSWSAPIIRSIWAIGWPRKNSKMDCTRVERQADAAWQRAQTAQVDERRSRVQSLRFRVHSCGRSQFDFSSLERCTLFALSKPYDPWLAAPFCLGKPSPLPLWHLDKIRIAVSKSEHAQPDGSDGPAERLVQNENLDAEIIRMNPNVSITALATGDVDYCQLFVRVVSAAIAACRAHRCGLSRQLADDAHRAT